MKVVWNTFNPKEKDKFECKIFPKSNEVKIKQNLNILIIIILVVKRIMNVQWSTLSDFLKEKNINVWKRTVRISNWIKTKIQWCL